MKDMRKVIGLMSGTSCDGIDACLVDITGCGIETRVDLLAFETCPYDDETRRRILDACQPETGTVDKICQLNFLIGHLFADSAKRVAEKAGVPLSDIDLIGSHGQTIYHIPANPPLPPFAKGGMGGLPGSTLQIGEPCVIAQETGITTVADFRTRDIAAGGQGAPLVPYADFVLFRSNSHGRAIQNIGGIANVTFLPRDCAIDDVIAFDSGPGNVIIDRITEIVTDGKSRFDLNGKLASSGRINNTLLDRLLSHPYFSKHPPKTTGREDFGTQFSDKLYAEAKQASLNDEDVLATVTAFTAKTIVDSYKRFILPWHDIAEVILCGGGSHNLFLVELLKEYVGSPTVKMIDEFGIPGDAKEAVAFAILANETISGNPNNVPSATGAREAVVLGKIVPSLGYRL
jgi:anhydro-N-acetylmuramic acid kinase